MVLRLFVVRTVKVRLFFYFGLTFETFFGIQSKIRGNCDVRYSLIPKG